MAKSTQKSEIENFQDESNIGTDFNFKREVVWFNAIGFLLLMITGFIGILAAVFGYCCWQTTLWSELYTKNLEKFQKIFS